MSYLIKVNCLNYYVEKRVAEGEVIETLENILEEVETPLTVSVTKTEKSDLMIQFENLLA